MAVTLFSARVWVANADVSGQLRSTRLDFAAEPLDATTLVDTTRKRVGGLKSVAMAHEGYWEAGASSSGIDPLFFGKIGQSNVPATVAAGASEGNVAYLLRALHTEYRHGGQVGELYPFGVTAEGDESPGLVRGVLLRNTTNETADANGTAFQLTASSSTLTIHGTLHVMGLSGSTAAQLTVSIQSDNSSAFGSPTTQINFSATTASTSQYTAAAAGTTDTWWRCVTAMAGTSNGATAHYAVAVGVST